MKVLKKEEKEIYDGLMKNIKIKKLDCWDYKAPNGFDGW